MSLLDYALVFGKFKEAISLKRANVPRTVGNFYLHRMSYRVTHLNYEEPHWFKSKLRAATDETVLIRRHGLLCLVKD
jgi:hypothetical protein